MGNMRETIQKELNSYSSDVGMASKKLEDKLFIRTRDLIRILPINKQTVYQWTKHNLIPYYKIGKSVYFDKGEVLEWLKRFYIPSKQS